MRYITANNYISLLTILIFSKSASYSQSTESANGTGSESLEKAAFKFISWHKDVPQYREKLMSNSIENRDATHCKCIEISACNKTENLGKVSNNQSKLHEHDEISNSQGSDIFGIVDLRLNINQCQNASEICCGEGVAAKSNNSTNDSSTTPVPVTAVTQSYVDSWKPNRCGQFKEGQTRFRWMVSVAVESTGGSGYTFLCYGSLIHPSVVLTTANCVFQAANSGIGNRNIRVILRDYETNGSRSDLQPQVVREVVFHENLYRKRYEFDLALLILEKEIVLSSEVDTVCLPSSETSDLTHFESMICTSTLKGDGPETELITKAEMFILTKEQCEEKLRKSSLRQSFKLHESLFCVEVNNPNNLPQNVNGTCEISKGAPLICRHGPTGYFIQVGIASWNLDTCNSKTIPNVYVNLPFLASWIRSKMRGRHFDPKYFKLVDDDLMMRIGLLKT